MEPKLYYKCTSCQKIYDNLNVCCSSKMEYLIRISSVFFHPQSIDVMGDLIHIQLTGRHILKHFAYGNHHIMDDNIHVIVKEIQYTENMEGAITRILLERVPS